MERRADIILLPNNQKAIFGQYLFEGLGIRIILFSSSSTEEGKNIAMIQIMNGKNLKKELNTFLQTCKQNRTLDKSQNKVYDLKHLHIGTPTRSKKTYPLKKHRSKKS